MAGWVLSECGIKPLPQIFPKPRTSFFSNSIKNHTHLQKVQFLHANKKILNPKFSPGSIPRLSRDKIWVLNVSAPSRIASLDEYEKGEKMETIDGVNGIGEEEEGEFDCGAPPPFKLADIRAAIPKHCWVKDPWRSMSYVVRDVAIVFGLAAGAAYLNNWFIWPLYWAAQGTMFWAFFVLGHDWYFQISHCFSLCFGSELTYVLVCV